MANKKISSLDSLGGTPDSADIIPITDVSDTTGSANGTTKKVTVADLVAAVPGGGIWAENNSGAYYSGNVGVGTTSPSAKLDVLTASSAEFALKVNNSTSTGHGAFIKGGGTSGQFRLKVESSENTDAPFIIRGDGNVGINTTNPSATLDIQGTAKLNGNDLATVDQLAAAPQGDLVASNNLSDVASAATSRTNLGLGDAATKTVGTADTNVIAVASGTVDLGGNKLEDFDASINDQTGTAYTLVAGDNGKVVVLDNASAVTVTVPSGLGVGFNCSFIQKGAGQVSFSTSGTTIYNRQSHTKINGQYGVASIVAYAADTFVLAGDTAS